MLTSRPVVRRISVIKRFLVLTVGLRPMPPVIAVRPRNPNQNVHALAVGRRGISLKIARRNENKSKAIVDGPAPAPAAPRTASVMMVKIAPERHVVSVASFIAPKAKKQVPTVGEFG